MRMWLCVFLLLMTGHATAQTGGFIEAQGTMPRARYTSGDITAFMPTTRGTFTFPAPYNTPAVRLTDATDCPTNQDCVWYVGYSYWNNINAHQNNPSTLYVMLGLEWNRGGVGPTIFSVNKHTLEVTKVGALFSSGDALRLQNGESWFFSLNPANPTRLYMMRFVPQAAFTYIDIVTKAITTVFDVTAQFGANRGICQMHANADDTVFAGTLVNTTAGNNCGTLTATDRLGCVVYTVAGPTWHYYPEIAGKDFNECTVDKSGLYVISLEDSGGGAEPTYNRFFTVATDAETRITGPTSTLGHMDTGYWYAVGHDNTNVQPQATIAYLLNPTVVPTNVMHFNNSNGGALNIDAANHVAHGNARASATSRNQMVCGSDGSTVTAIQNEIVCFRLEASYGQQLVVAPVMTNPATGGGFSSYGRAPKGNLDVTGEFFIWTSNLAGSSRLDAFIVRVPQHKVVPRAHF